MDALKEWLAAERGRGARLSIRLGITQGALSQWSQVPADRVADVEALTGIPRTELRPDVFRDRDAPLPAKTGQAAA